MIHWRSKERKPYRIGGRQSPRSLAIGFGLSAKPGSPFATTRLTCLSPNSPLLRCGTNNCFLPFGLRLDESLPALPQGVGIGSNDPGSAGHDAGAVVGEEVFKRRIGGPRTGRGGQERGTPIGRAIGPSIAVKGELAQSSELLFAAAFGQGVVQNRGWRVWIGLRGSRHQYDADGLLNALKDARVDLGLMALPGSSR